MLTVLLALPSLVLILVVHLHLFPRSVRLVSLSVLKRWVTLLVVVWVWLVMVVVPWERE